MITILTETYLQAFKDYLRNTNSNFDDYFLSDEMINHYDLNKNYTLIHLENNEITGIISVMKDYGVRLRIIDGREENLLDLHKHMLELIAQNHIMSYKAFIDIEDHKILDFYNQHLSYERTVYALEREPLPIEVSYLEVNIRPLELPEEKDIYANIRNQAFEPVKGFEFRNGDFYKDMHHSEEYVKEWTLLLSIDKPIGIIKAAKEYENGRIQAYIGPIAILPEHQKKGFGKHLLSQLIKIINKDDYISALSVNADNENALKLYYDLGFKKMKVVKAYI